VIKEEQATGGWSSDNAYGFGAAGGDLGGGLIFGKGVVLPAGLVRALEAIDSNQAPGVRELLELFE